MGEISAPVCAHNMHAVKPISAFLAFSGFDVGFNGLRPETFLERLSGACNSAYVKSFFFHQYCSAAKDKMS
jgi:hypothetical protein